MAIRWCATHRSVICRLTVIVGNVSGEPVPGQTRSVSVPAVGLKTISRCWTFCVPSLRSTWNLTESAVPDTSAGTVAE